MDLTYVKQASESVGDAGDKYTGLDRFGRIVNQRWAKTVGGAVTDVDRFQYSYDRNSNIVSRVNVLDSTKNETYTYDNLNQMATVARGGTTRTQNFTADAMGKFSSVVSGSNGVNTTQGRTHNAQNELTSISGTAATPTYDANGNLTKDETGALLTYDAWNRLVKVVKGTTTVTYSYDMLGRRIIESVDGTAKDLYYSKDWQVIEERTSGVVKTQYVWSPVYVDAMIERDFDADGNLATGTNGLEQRLWPLQDANFNTTALVKATTTGGVTTVTTEEKFLYDPYGRLTDASGNAVSPLAANKWIYLHQGGRLDATTGLYNFRNRDYSPTLMRWTTNDPIGFGGGDTNTYRYEANNSIINNDPSGLILPLILWVGAGVATGGIGGLHYSAWRYDYARERYLERPGIEFTPEVRKEFKNHVETTGYIAATSEVAANTGIAMAAAPAVGYGAGYVWGMPGYLGTAGRIGVTGVGVYGADQAIGESVSIVSEWQKMEGALRLRRTGNLLGPLAAGAFSSRYAAKGYEDGLNAAYSRLATRALPNAELQAAEIAQFASSNKIPLPMAQQRTSLPVQTVRPLDWKAVVPKKGPYKGEPRDVHVRRHNLDDLLKDDHGVFRGDAVDLTNHARARAQILKIKPDAIGEMIVPMGAVVGDAGGIFGAAARTAGRPTEFKSIFIKVVPGTDNIITAYPTY